MLFVNRNHQNNSREIQKIYNEAAESLGFMRGGKPDPTRLFMIDENIPDDPDERVESQSPVIKIMD